MADSSPCVHETVSFPNFGPSVSHVNDNSHQGAMARDVGVDNVDALVFRTGVDLYDMRVGGRQRRRSTAVRQVTQPISMHDDSLWSCIMTSLYSIFAWFDTVLQYAYFPV